MSLHAVPVAFVIVTIGAATLFTVAVNLVKPVMALVKTPCVL